MSIFPVTLLENPRQNFRHFHRAVIAAYGAECPHIYPHGLLGFIVSDAQWTQLPGNLEQPDDAALPPVLLPRPTIIVPPTPAANAAPLTIKVWERRLADNLLCTDNLRRLKSLLLASIAPADLVVLHDPLFGLLNITALTIMNHVTILHGTRNQTDFAHLRAQLLTTMTSRDSVQDFIGSHQLLHDQFAESNQPLSELDKCHHFREAVQTQAHVQHAIDSYLVAHPLVGDQTFITLTTHVLQQAPNFAPTVASMGYSASTTIDSPHIQSEAFLASPAFVALITAAVRAAQPPSRKSRRERALKPITRAYCYHHGYDTHNSADCRYMTAQSFSTDKKTAKTHLDITGGSSNRL
jgi:hypothetical protein